MLTENDINQLKGLLATKEDLKAFTLKLVAAEEFDEFRQENNQKLSSIDESINTLTNTIDSFLKKMEDLKDEDAMATEKLKRHEKWLTQMAEKLGMKLEY